VLSKTILTKKMFKIWSKPCDIIRRVAETKCVGTQLHDSEVFLVYIYIPRKEKNIDFIVFL